MADGVVTGGYCEAGEEVDDRHVTQDVSCPEGGVRPILTTRQVSQEAGKILGIVRTFKSGYN